MFSSKGVFRDRDLVHYRFDNGFRIGFGEYQETSIANGRALQRAQELIGVGQSQAALQTLHEHVVSKRTRNSPIASLEPVMIQFVELCVNLRKGKLAKDGLYQYKNTAQNTNVGTIEVCLAIQTGWAVALREMLSGDVSPHPISCSCFGVVRARRSYLNYGSN